MSAKSRPTQAAQAFHNILDHYYSAKTSAYGGSASGFSKLQRTVGTLNGVVRVSPSDLVADVELAANRALREYPAEKKAFQRIYIEADTAFREVFSRKLNQQAFDGLISEIENRVGQEFINAGIYPLENYTRTVDVR